MARSAKSPAAEPAAKKTAAATIAKKSGGTSLATIDQELANEVVSLKEQIGQPSGNRIKVEATGDFILPDGQNMGDEIQVVVIDFVSTNKFYSGPYNPNNPSPPDCYAIGRKLSEMAPEDDSPAIQADACATCALNQFGSGNNGKSKACKNTRTLAVVLVDPEDPSAAAALDAPIYTMDLPPTAIRSFDGAVSAVARSLAGPPVKAVLTVSARNVGTYAQITFTDPVPNPDYAVHYSRRAECQDQLFRKPDFTPRDTKPAARGRGASPARRAAPSRR